MKSQRAYWGVVGAGLALLLSAAALVASLAGIPDEVAAVWSAATYPVTKAWEAFLLTRDGDQGMMYIVPMLASQLLFVVAVGAGVGALLGGLRGGNHAEPVGGANSHPPTP